MALHCTGEAAGSQAWPLSTQAVCQSEGKPGRTVPVQDQHRQRGQRETLSKSRDKEKQGGDKSAALRKAKRSLFVFKEPKLLG